jgi:hypothetical protein
MKLLTLLAKSQSLLGVTSTGLPLALNLLNYQVPPSPNFCIPSTLWDPCIRPEQVSPIYPAAFTLLNRLRTTSTRRADRAHGAALFAPDTYGDPCRPRRFPLFTTSAKFKLCSATLRHPSRKAIMFV